MAHPVSVERSRAIPINPEGTWIFGPAGTGTRVTWRWVLHPKSAFSAPALPVFARLWRGYAGRSLETLSDYLVS